MNRYRVCRSMAALDTDAVEQHNVETIADYADQ
jgi:hypothetical protein